MNTKGCNDDFKGINRKHQVTIHQLRTGKSSIVKRSASTILGTQTTRGARPVVGVSKRLFVTF